MWGDKMTVFKTNDHDYSQYIERGGLGWTRNDLDGSETTRLKNGKMRRQKITEKRTLNLKFMGMNRGLIAQLDNDMRRTTFQATYTDIHGEQTREFYCTSLSATLQEVQDEELQQWDGAAITIVEV